MILAEATMSVPVGWVLSSGAALAGAISYLAKLVFNSQQKQIDSLREDVRQMREENKDDAETIKAQNKIILNLQKDIDDLKKGCKAPGCHWKA